MIEKNKKTEQPKYENLNDMPRNTEDDLIDLLQEYAKQYESLILIDPTSKNKKLNKAEQYLDIILVCCNVIIIREKVGRKMISYPYVMNMDTRVYGVLENAIGKYMYHLRKVGTISNVRFFARDIVYYASQIDPSAKVNKGLVETYRPNPSHIVKVRNGYVNTIDGSFSTDHSQYKGYHFLRYVDIEYKEQKDCNPLYVKIVNRLMDDWSGNDASMRKYLMQILLAAFEGNGRQKIHVLKSEGGDGKSSFMKIAKLLAGGDGYAVDCNLQEFDNDNIINQISPSTAIIVGDDLPTDANLGGNRLPRIKTYISGGVIQANVKYSDNALVKSTAGIIQATNSDFSANENSPAVADRMIVTDWPHYNFRQNPVDEFDLDELLMTCNDEFLTAFLSVVLSEQLSFKMFDIPESSKENTKRMISESDAVYQTVQDMHLKGLLNVERLPEKVIYNYYVNSWLKENNSGAKPLSAIKFNKRLVVVMSQFGFKYLQNNNEDVIARIKTLETKSKLSFNLDVFEHLADCSLNLTEQAQSRCFVKEDNKITDHDIENYKARINQLGEIPDDTDDNIKSALILYYLTNIDHDPDVIAKLEGF